MPDQSSPPQVDAAVRSDLAPPPGSGLLRVAVLDDETGQPLPSRVIISAADGSSLPFTFDVDRHGKSAGGAYGVGIAPGVIGAPEGVMLAAGDGAWKMPAGSYQLFITHGPEWEADTRKITITDHTNVSLTSSLRHSVDTRGWLAADMHIHTRRSFDSSIQLEDRVVSEVSVGVEVLVATDHNGLTDLQPQVEMFGYDSIARAIVGDEFNFAEGHGGAYPMPYDKTDPTVGGGVDKFHLDWATVKNIHSADMFNFVRSFPTRPAISVNHPYWPGSDLGYFTNLNWSPPATMPDAGLFDAMEVLNGYLMAPEFVAVLMRDWFFLLSSGTRVTALGNSDTHALRDVKAGFPRTWLRMPTDDPSKILDSDLADAVKAQRAIASNGPFALLTVDGKAIGDTVTNPTGTVTIDALVDAPEWIDVDHVRLYVNGQIVQDFPVKQPGLRPVFHNRWDQKLPPGDAWIVLQAGGKRPLPVALIGEHGGGTVVPFVITNPVFVDGDGDGLWKPVIANPDPGPLAPINLTGAASWPDWHPAPQDCEPPLWADPATWANP